MRLVETLLDMQLYEPALADDLFAVACEQSDRIRPTDFIKIACAAPRNWRKNSRASLPILLELTENHRCSLCSSTNSASRGLGWPPKKMREVWVGRDETVAR